MSGSFLFVTMALALRLNLLNGFFRFFSGCTRGKSILVRGLVWRCARRLWSSSWENSGWNQNRGRGRRFIFLFLITVSGNNCKYSTYKNYSQYCKRERICLLYCRRYRPDESALKRSITIFMCGTPFYFSLLGEVRNDQPTVCAVG